MPRALPGSMESLTSHWTVLSSWETHLVDQGGKPVQRLDLLPLLGTHLLDLGVQLHTEGGQEALVDSDLVMLPGGHMDGHMGPRATLPNTLPAKTTGPAPSIPRAKPKAVTSSPNAVTSHIEGNTPIPSENVEASAAKVSPSSFASCTVRSRTAHSLPQPHCRVPTEATLVATRLDVQLPAHGGKDGVGRAGEMQSPTEREHSMGHPEHGFLSSCPSLDTRKGRLSSISSPPAEGPGAVDSLGNRHLQALCSNKAVLIASGICCPCRLEGSNRAFICAHN